MKPEVIRREASPNVEQREYLDGWVTELEQQNSNGVIEVHFRDGAIEEIKQRPVKTKRFKTRR